MKISTPESLQKSRERATEQGGALHGCSGLEEEEEGSLSSSPFRWWCIGQDLPHERMCLEGYHGAGTGEMKQEVGQRERMYQILCELLHVAVCFSYCSRSVTPTFCV